MAERADLFTRAIENMLTFPATMTGVLLRPSKVFEKAHEAQRCPPGVALVIGLTVWFWGNRTLLRISSGDLTVPLNPGGELIGRIVIGVGAVVLLQTVLLSGLFRARWDWRTSAAYLAYPIAIVLFAVGAVEIAGVYFPSAVKTLARGIALAECRTDELIVDCAKWQATHAGTFSLQVTSLTSLLPILLYPWATFNVIRVSLAVPSRRGLWMSVVALAALVGVAGSGVFLMSDSEERIKQLAKEETLQRKSMSEAEHR